MTPRDYLALGDGDGKRNVFIMLGMYTSFLCSKSKIK